MAEKESDVSMEPAAYTTGLHNTSEIGRLRKVMLHRPGRELEKGPALRRGLSFFEENRPFTDFAG